MQNSETGRSKEIEALQRTNRLLVQRSEHLKRKFDVMHRAFLELADSKIVPTESPFADLAAVETRFVEDAETTLFAFGGMMTMLGIPPREFFGSIRNERCNIIFVKDFAQCWYQKGILGLSRSIEDSVSILKSLIPPKTKHIRTFGTSSGGFAAIYFGMMLQADRVCAFGPQTCVRPEDFKTFGSQDSRPAEFDFSSPTSDLGLLFDQEDRRHPPEVEIWFSEKNETDQWHASRLKDKANVTLYPVAGEQNHNIAAVLKSRGELVPILRRLVHSG